MNKKFTKFLILLTLFSQQYRSNAQNIEVAALGVGMASLLVGSAMLEEDIAEQLEASALDYLLSEGTTGSINIKLVQRTFNNNRAFRNGAQGSALTFLVTRFDPSSQQIIEKKLLLLLVRNRVINEYGITYKPYNWYYMSIEEWKNIVKETLKTIGPYYTQGQYQYMYERTRNKEADIVIKDLNQGDQAGQISDVTLDKLVVTNEFDKIKKSNLNYDISDDSYIINSIVLSGEELKVFNNEGFVGIYSPILGCHALINLKDLSYINSFIFDL